MATITRIPSEILEEIFYQSLPTLFKGPNGLPRIHADGEEDPATLEQELTESFTSDDEVDSTRMTLKCICRSWRNLVLDSPKLWSRLEVNAVEFQKDPQRLMTLLDRSKNHDLEIKLISVRSKQDNFMSANIQLNRPARGLQQFSEVPDCSPQAVINILRDQFHRLRVFGIDCNAHGSVDHLAHFFPQNIRSSFPRLEHFFAISNCHPLRAGSIGYIEAPQLKSCFIPQGLDVLWKAFSPSTQKNLTRISLVVHNEQLGQGEKFLSLCEHLQTLSLTVSRSFGRALGNFPYSFSVSSEFPRLQSLSLKLDSAEQYRSISQYFKFPELRFLTARGNGFTSVACIENLLERNPRLRELRLDKFSFEEYPNHLLSPLTELRSLVVSRSLPRKNFLRSNFLPQPHTNQFSLPNLEISLLRSLQLVSQFQKPCFK
ncbi:hypothetical protein M422DRAFT_52149 [Sphaerobolus stellatus SS14]|uniref:F-box domain-containing protein n=1 Tax=Sphaerobolus stellatus (strain SS14) TaxID=990650 RepID=A0A0C9V9K4_SPHS4|nr:hypothetical protein M422DRAFT_52149 [Sphaerobolus stellatus SS14]